MDIQRRRALALASPLAAVAAVAATGCTPTAPSPAPEPGDPGAPRGPHQLYLSDFAPAGGAESARQGLQDALAELRGQGGGELVVDGLYLIDGWGVDVAMELDQLNHVTIRGTGGYSGFVLLGGDAEQVMVNLGRIVSLRFVDLVFYGSATYDTASPQSIRPDFKKGLYLWDCASVTFDRCLFVGLVANTVGEADSWGLGAVLHAERSPVYLRDTMFLGCGGTIAGWGAEYDTPVVRSTGFTSLVAENCRWKDVYDGGWQGEPQRFRRHPSAHVLLQDPWMPAGGMKGHNVRGAVLRNCHFDEASGCAVEVRNLLGTDRLRQLLVDTCSIASASAALNNTGHRKPAPLLVRSVDDVKVLTSYFGDYGSHPVAMRFEDCDHVLVDSPTGAAPATTIQADAACGTLAYRALRGTLTVVDSAAARTVDLEQLHAPAGAPDATDAAGPASAGAALLPSPLVHSTLPRTAPVGDHDVLEPGRLHLAAIELPAGLTVDAITFYSGATALSGATNQWFALFDASGSALALTEDDTAGAWAPGTAKTLRLPGAHVTTYGGLHYVGIVVAAATVPSLVAVEGLASFSAQLPVLAGRGVAALTAAPSLPFATALEGAAHLPFAGVS